MIELLKDKAIVRSSQLSDISKLTQIVDKAITEEFDYVLSDEFSNVIITETGEYLIDLNNYGN